MKTHLVTVLIGLAACAHEAPRGAATLASRDSVKDSVAVPPADANLRPRGAKDLPDSMGEVLGVRLNRDSLISVRSRLGPTAEWETGDASEAMVWWCYRLGDDMDRAMVTFGSSGEMGGPNHEVQDIRVTRWSRVGADSAHCSPAHTSQRPVTPGGLHISITQAQVRHLFTVVPVAASDSLRFEWQTEEPLSPREPTYAHWDSLRTSCFGGRAPFVDVSAHVTVRFDQRGAYEYVLSRDNAIC